MNILKHCCFVLLVFIAFSVVLWAAEKKLVRLDLRLTEDAVTKATPGLGKGLKPTNLRKEEKRPPFMLREGLKNISLYKPVTGSEKPSNGDLDQITDGIRKSDDFDYVEGPGWVQIDLEEISEIHAVIIWHFYKNPVIYKDVIVRIADDLKFTKNVRVLFNNDHDASAGLGKGSDTAYISRWWGEIIDARGKDHSGTLARTIRIHTGKGMEGEEPRYVEVAVYGTTSYNK